MNKLIGLFGITGNPPHFGHMNVIDVIAKDCDEVWVSLVYIHPFGKVFVDYELRKKMLLAVINDYGFNSDVFNKIKIKDIDRDYYFENKKVPFSYDLLVYLKNNNKDSNFKLIIGEDNYVPSVWNKFYEKEKIEQEFGLLIAKDSGVHSTYIRENNGSIDLSNYLGVHASKIIEENDLYKNN